MIEAEVKQNGVEQMPQTNLFNSSLVLIRPDEQI
jgi:hypothetical protein